MLFVCKREINTAQRLLIIIAVVGSMIIVISILIAIKFIGDRKPLNGEKRERKKVGETKKKETHIDKNELKGLAINEIRENILKCTYDRMVLLNL